MGDYARVTLFAHRHLLFLSLILAPTRYGDTEDFFVTRVRKNPEDINTWQYEYDGQWRNATTTREEITVKGSGKRVVEIIRTHRGVLLEPAALQLLEPVADSVFESAKKEAKSSDSLSTRIAIEYSGIQLRSKSKAVESLQQLLHARSFDDFDTACTGLSKNICLNLCYADIKGHIGYVFTGELPVRQGPRGTELLPLRGWSSAHDYKGYLEHRQLPKELDPEQGYIVSANHCIVDYKGGYPHYLGQAIA